MKRKRKTWLIIFITISLIAVGLVIAQYFLEQKIKEKLGQGLGQVFALELDEFEVDLSFIKNFPRTNLCIQHLTFFESIRTDTASLFHVHNADFQIDLPSIFQDTLIIAKGVLSGAHIRFKTDSTGKNTRLFRYRTDEDRFKNKAPNINFEELLFQNVTLSGDNQFKQTKWSLSIDSAALSGQLQQRIWSLTGGIYGHFDSLVIRDGQFISGKPIQLQTHFTHDSKMRKSLFTNTVLTYEHAAFDGQASIEQDYPKGNILDITLIGKQDFGTLLGVLPPELKPNIRQINPDATTKTLVSFKGLNGPTSNVATNFLIEVQDAALESMEYPARFEDLDFVMEYSNGVDRSSTTSELNIKTFRGLMNQRPVELTGTIVNLIEPAIDMDFDLNMNLQDFRQFFPIKGIKELGGTLSLKGHYQKNAPNAPTNIQMDGTIDLDDDNLRLEADGFDFTNLKGKIYIKDNQLNIQKIKGIFSDIPFTMTGSAENIYRLFLKNEGQLKANVNVYSDLTNLNTILNTVTAGNLNTRNGGNPLAFPDYLHGDLTMNTPKLLYKTTTAHNVKAKLLFRGKHLSIPYFDMQVLDGKLSINANLKPKAKGNYEVYTQMTAKNINTKKLLALYDNFNQSLLTSENIEGSLNAEVNMQGLLNNELDYIENEISYDAKFSLKKGELIDFEPVTKAFQNFRKRARAHIYIDHAEGEVFYNRGKMIVPNVYFTSNLSAVKLFGERQPNESMDFYFNFSLTDLLFGNAQKRKKRKKVNKKPGNFHIKLEGKPHNLVVNAIRRGVYNDQERTIKQSYRTEKKLAFP